MKFWQYVVGSVLAALIFAAGFLSEGSRLSQYLEIQSSKDLLQKTTVEEQSAFTDTFFPNGEFLRSFKGTNVSFENEKRELFSGEVFIGGAFFSLESVQEVLRNKPFQLQTFGTLPNTIKLGTVLVHYRNSNVFVSRDAIKKRSEIWAVGHSVDIWFDGRKNPFVLPSDTKLTIRESLINTDSANLFYTKLKKDFQMQSFELVGTDVGKNETVEQKILTALVKHRNWRKQFQDLAWNIPLLWNRGEPDSFSRRVGDFLYAYTIGISQHKKAFFQFKNFVEPLVLSRQTAEDNKETEGVIKKLKEFIPTFENPEWKSVLNDENIRNEWQSFSLAQKTWLPMISPESPAFQFFVLWEQPRITPLDKIEHLFTRAEVLAANRYPDATKSNLLELKSQWQQTSFTSQDKIRVTRLRRLVMEMIRAHSFLHQAEFFELHEALAQTELSLYSNEPDVEEELRLEIGQDLLSFLQKFLHLKTEKNVTKTLLSSWYARDIDVIAEKIGREIFTPEQKEVIELIKIVGDSGLTPEEIIAIKETDIRQHELELATETIEDGDVILSEATSGIRGAKDLLVYLKEQNIVVDLKEFKTDKESGETIFKGMIDEDPITGIFSYKTQQFKEITAFDATETNMAPIIMSKWIRSIMPVNVDEVTPADTFNFNTNVSQITSEAILSRRFLQTMLQSLDISVERNNIGILDEAHTQFQFISALYQDVLLSGKYNKSDDAFSEIVLQKGDKKIEIVEATPKSLFLEKLKETVQKNWGSVWDEV
jgi:hypothetical protein